MAAVVYEVGDVVTLKKGHPCGSKEWEILRVGADFRLKCMGCWTPDHGTAEDGGEKHKKSSKKGKIMLYSLKKVC